MGRSEKPMKPFLSWRNLTILALVAVVVGLLVILLWPGRLTTQANANQPVATTGYLGITYMDVNMHMAMSRNLPCNEGALVTAVTPRSPAEQAGLQAGDVIVSLDNQPVGATCPLLQSLLNRRAGEQVAVTIQRNDQFLTIPITLAARAVDSR